MAVLVIRVEVDVNPAQNDPWEIGEDLLEEKSDGPVVEFLHAEWSVDPFRTD